MSMTYYQTLLNGFKSLGLSERESGNVAVILDKVLKWRLPLDNILLELKKHIIRDRDELVEIAKKIFLHGLTFVDGYHPY